MRIVFLFLLLFLILPARLFTQDISGVWTGSIQTEGNKLTYELVISGSSENLSGYALTIFNIGGKENIGIKSIILKDRKGNVSLEDDELIYDNYTTSPRRMKLFAKLSLNSAGSTITLAGNFHTRSMDMRSNGLSYTGVIFLQKQKKETRTRLVAELDSMGLLNQVSLTKPAAPKNNEPAKPPENKKTEVKKPIEKPVSEVKKIPETNIAEVRKPVSVLPAAEISRRKTQVIRNVLFHSDSLRLTLYDNGTVDGDTVSVLLNGNVILAKKGLSTLPIRATIPASAALGDSILLIMYAENLGSIPPNSGLLIIEDGDDRYEIRFEGDLQNSAAIILRRRK